MRTFENVLRAIAVFGFLTLLLVAINTIAGCNGRCGSSACIDIEPIPEECTDAYDQGFQDGVDSVECEVDDDWTDECDADVPPGHLAKHCRGKSDR